MKDPWNYCDKCNVKLIEGEYVTCDKCLDRMLIQKRLKEAEAYCKTGDNCSKCGRPLILFEEDLCTFCGG